MRARHIRVGMLVALPAVAVAVAVQLFSAPPSAAQSAVSPCQQPVRPGNSEVTLLSSGRERTAIVHVPPAAAGRPLPLVVGLHGAGGQFFEPYSGLSVLADSEGFIAVYPNPIFRAGSHSSWDIEESQPGSGPNDVQFISDLLDYVESNLCVDASRVYALGVSNGGGMAARAVCQLSSRFAGFASIAGGYKALPPCQPTNPVSVIEVHGTADGSVPYNGVPPDRAGAVRPWLAAWRSRDGCRGAPVVSRIAPRVERYDWTHCAQGTAVEHLEIFGGNHQLPGGLPPDRGQTGTVAAVWLAWSFLRARVQAGPATPPSSQLPAGGASPGP